MFSERFSHGLSLSKPTCPRCPTAATAIDQLGLGAAHRHSCCAVRYRPSCATPNTNRQSAGAVSTLHQGGGSLSIASCSTWATVKGDVSLLSLKPARKSLITQLPAGLWSK